MRLSSLVYDLENLSFLKLKFSEKQKIHRESSVQVSDILI